MKPDILKWGLTNEKGEVHSKCGRFFIERDDNPNNRGGYRTWAADTILEDGAPYIADKAISYWSRVWHHDRLGDAKRHAQDRLDLRLGVPITPTVATDAKTGPLPPSPEALNRAMQKDGIPNWDFPVE